MLMCTQAASSWVELQAQLYYIKKFRYISHNAIFGQNEAHNIMMNVITWKHFPRYWLFVRGIHRSPVNSPHKGQRRGALMFSLICAWTNRWVNNREAGDLRCHRAHYDVIVMSRIAMEPCRTESTESFFCCILLALICIDFYVSGFVISACLCFKYVCLVSWNIPVMKPCCTENCVLLHFPNSCYSHGIPRGWCCLTRLPLFWKCMIKFLKRSVAKHESDKKYKHSSRPFYSPNVF